MNDLQEIFSNAVGAIKSRSSNPLLIAFLFSWATWNYKFFLILFLDGGDWSEKIYYIENFIFGGEYALARNFIFPLITSFVWIYILPPFFRKVAVWQLRQNNITQYAIKRASRDKMLSKDENIKLRKYLYSQWQELGKLTEEHSFALERQHKLYSELDTKHANALTVNAQLKESIEIKSNEIKLKDSEITRLEKKYNKQYQDNYPTPFEFDKKRLNSKDFNLSDIFFIQNRKVTNKYTKFVKNERFVVYLPCVAQRTLIFDGKTLFLQHDVIADEFVFIVLILVDWLKRNGTNSISGFDYKRLVKNHGLNPYVMKSYFTFYGIFRDFEIDSNNSILFIGEAGELFVYYRFFKEIGFLVNEEVFKETGFFSN